MPCRLPSANVKAKAGTSLNSSLKTGLFWLTFIKFFCLIFTRVFFIYHSGINYSLIRSPGDQLSISVIKGMIMDYSPDHRFFRSLLNKTKKSGVCLVTIALLSGVIGCSYFSEEPEAETRGAKIFNQDNFGDSVTRVIYPEQNWSATESLWFYNLPQGSNLIPYDIFLHLELPGNNELFRSDSNMDRLRYLPQKPTHENPDGLPVGWVKSESNSQQFIGFTCAACHTSQINYQGLAIRIDGGAPLADMELMLENLSGALNASLEQPEKFERLAKKVLGKKYPDNKEVFRAELSRAANNVSTYVKLNEPRHGDQTVPYGYGRLDAFGRIYNRILSHLTPDDLSNANPANAPVSYPHLWDTPQHDFVQWNGVGDNEKTGPVARNVGEALGVFADVDLRMKEGDQGFRSSVLINNLVSMEQYLERLWSPSWEELAARKALPPINKAQAEKGKQVFFEYQCHTCHEDIDRKDPNRRVIAQFASLPAVGTDPLTAINALKYNGKSGAFEGQKMNPLQPDSKTFDAVTPVLPALSLATEGVIVQSAGADFSPPNPVDKTQRHVDHEVVNKNDPRTLASYKARPLNGIWASAPYLHNGSVPSLYELFLPSCSDDEIASGKSCRPNRFTLGSRELDPTKVGFVQRDPAKYPALFVFDTGLPGNSNKGHEYASGVTPLFVLDSNGRPVRDNQGKPQLRKLQPITDEQRIALVEYLKTL